MSGFYKFAVGVMRLLMPLCFRMEAKGRENVPKEGGYLFISNHRSNADPIIIGIQNHKTQFCFLAKQELFQQGFAGWILRNLGAIAIDRGSGDLSPLDELKGQLQSGSNALIFPEGTRSKDGKLLRFKTGAALLAAQTGIPIVPVAISFEGKLHFRSKITVSYGAPFTVPHSAPDEMPAPGVLKQIRKEMTEHVAALLPPAEDVKQIKDRSEKEGDSAS